MAHSVGNDVSTARDLSSSLPDELLAEIFLHLHSCRLGERERDDLAYHPTPPWAPASHVCARWCNVAINCKKLWSLIVDADPHWIEISVKRSDPLPISLRAEIYLKTPPESIAALIDLIQPVRLVSVQIWINASASTDPDDEPYTWWLIKLTTSPTPLLKHFEIAVSYEQVGGPSHDTTNIDLCLPWDYLGKGEESPLRSLKLSQCVLTTLFALHGSSKLVSLKLCHCFYSEDEDGDVLGYDLLLDALSASPNLEYLCLSWSTSPSGPDLDSSFEKHSIKLPRLRAFHLDDDLARAFDLLSYISIPSSANTRIGLEWETEEADVASQIAKVQDFDIDRLLLDSQSSPYRVFYITQREDRASRIAFDVSLSKGLIGQRDEQTLTFNFDITSSDSGPASAILATIVTSLSPLLPLTDALVMGVNPVLFDWVRHVSDWRNVQRLDVFGTAAAVALLDAWNNRNTPLILPNVTSLLINRVDLMADATAEKLIHAVVQRQFMSSPCAKLANLILDTPLVAQRTIDILGKILPIENQGALCVRRGTFDAEGEEIRAEA